MKDWAPAPQTLRNPKSIPKRILFTEYCIYSNKRPKENFARQGKITVNLNVTRITQKHDIYTKQRQEQNKDKKKTQVKKTQNG